jgi:hypothetical protein
VRQHAEVLRGDRVDFDGDRPPAVTNAPNSTERVLDRDELIIGEEILTPSQTLFWRAALPIEPFREEFVPVEDYALGAMLALRGIRTMATDAITTAYRLHPGQSAGLRLGAAGMQRRSSVIDDLGRQLPDERRLHRRIRGHHELFARLPAELAARRRHRAVAAVLSSAVWSPRLLRTSMWWRAAARAAVRRSRA